MMNGQGDRIVVCPHCEEQSFSFYEVKRLGPARSLCCSACGERASVSWPLMLNCAFILIGPALLLCGAVAAILGPHSKSPKNSLAIILFNASIVIMVRPMVRYWRKHLRLVKR